MNEPSDPAQRCGACGAPVERGARFCGACGAASGQAVGVGQDADAGRHRWVIAVAVVAVVGLVGLAALGMFALGEGDSDGEKVGTDLGMPDPQTVDMPPLPDDRDQVLSYMQEGEGRLLREFHSATAGLVDLDVAADDAAGRCRGLVEQRLSDIAEEPADLLTVAAAVPDETTAHLIVNDVAAKRDLLASCAASEVEAALDFRDEVAFTHALVQRRLAEIGIVSEDVP